MASIKAKNELVSVKLAKGRLSYPCLHKNMEFKEKDRGYRGTDLLLSKDNPAHVKFVDALRVAIKSYRDSAGTKLTNIPIKDGDKLNEGFVEEGEDVKEELVNCWIISIQNKAGFSILDGQRKQVPDDKVESLFYGGSYANAILSSSCYSNDYGVHVALKINGLMWAGDGESFGASVQAADVSEFDDFDSSEPSTKSSADDKTTSGADTDDDEF